jgi:hypothetical protein
MDIASQLDAIQREVERTPATDDAGAVIRPQSSLGQDRHARTRSAQRKATVKGGPSRHELVAGARRWRQRSSWTLRTPRILEPRVSPHLAVLATRRRSAASSQVVASRRFAGA